MFGVTSRIDNRIQEFLLRFREFHSSCFFPHSHRLLTQAECRLLRQAVQVNGASSGLGFAVRRVAKHSDSDRGDPAKC
jgi:hypothetical protein